MAVVLPESDYQYLAGRCSLGSHTIRWETDLAIASGRTAFVDLEPYIPTTIECLCGLALWNLGKVELEWSWMGDGCDC